MGGISGENLSPTRDLKRPLNIFQAALFQERN